MPRRRDVWPNPALNELSAGGRTLIHKGLPRGGLTRHDDGKRIQPILLAMHTGEQRSNFMIVVVVDAHRNAGAAIRCDHFGCFLDGLGPSSVDVV
jgi:hypothetical protein